MTERTDAQRDVLTTRARSDRNHEAQINVDYHVRRTALPAPGSDEELRNLVGRVMSQQLDRAKPLWELWVAAGLEDGHSDTVKA